MKYTVEIDIDLPVNRVIELFDNTDNLYKWMEGLVSFEAISGTPGQVGAKSRLKFKMGKRNFEMEETITAKNLPQQFDGTYETNNVTNIIKTKFIPLSDNKTKYVSEQEFQFEGFVMKAIAFLMPGAFKKQSMKYMQDFKTFAESQK